MIHMRLVLVWGQMFYLRNLENSMYTVIPSMYSLVIPHPSS